MPHHETIALSGIIRHVFAHRFTLEADGRLMLADLGPKGADAFALTEGLRVTVAGERRPSEIKVAEIAREGETPVVIHHKKPHHGVGERRHKGGQGPRHDLRHHEPRPHGHHAGHRHEEADPALALRAADAAGFSAKGAPRRKPKHFEVLARRSDGPWVELHIDLDGGLYKVKALPPDGGKWADALA